MSIEHETKPKLKLKRNETHQTHHTQTQRVIYFAKLKRNEFIYCPIYFINVVDLRVTFAALHIMAFDMATAGIMICGCDCHWDWDRDWYINRNER